MKYSFEFYTSTFRISHEDDLVKINVTDNFEEPKSVPLYIDEDELNTLIEVLNNVKDIMYSKKNNAE